MAINATFVDTETFTVATDLTVEFHQGRRVKADCGVDGYKYGTIASSSFGATTEVVLVVASDNLTSNLTEVWYGIIGKGANHSMPDHEHDTSEGAGKGIDELYYNETKVFETIATGISITDGTAIAATIEFSADDFIIKNNDPDGFVIIRGTRDVGTQSDIIHANPDSNTYFFFDGLQVLGTRSTGLSIFSSLDASKIGHYYLIGDDLHIKSDVDGGSIKMESDHIADGSQSFIFIGDPDGAAELYYNGTLTTQTISGGLQIDGVLSILERSSDPTQPAEGETVIWMSDGTEKGDDGDVMIAGTAGGTTNYTTLFDHSAGTPW